MRWLCDVNRLIGADGRPSPLSECSYSKNDGTGEVQMVATDQIAVPRDEHTLDGSLNMQIVVVVLILPINQTVS